ncbi:MAG: TRAP transporter small permease subunit [Candidatus Accumulibacter sp.]|nr:TRAP transporter small permease subunit [Accumulibacter sp.]
MNCINRITKVIDQISLWTGKAIAWLVIPMAGVLVYEVFVRTFFRPTLWAIDMAMIFYGFHFFLAGAMTLCLGKHIRTDFFYGKWSMRTQCWVDLVCYVFLFLPGMVLFVYLSWDFFYESWELKENMMTTWRPPAYPYKLVIPVSGALILLQGISEVLKCVQTLRTGVDHRYRGEEREIT